MNRFFLLVPVVAALIGGCGGSPPATPAAGLTQTAAEGDSGTLVVEQDGRRPRLTAWYVRIETAGAATVAEAAYPRDAIALTKQLPAGKYRVISWHRPCSDSCPASGETGLGPLQQVCGAKVDVTGGARVTATVRIAAGGTCSIGT